jgi:head-tail adaptor
MAYDVRYMTGEEVEEWAQQRHVEADVAAVTAREIATSGNQEVEGEDFAPRSE